MDFDTYYLLALRYLNIRFRSEKEIRDYLRKKLTKVEPSSQKYLANSGKKFDLPETRDSEGLIELIIQKLKEQKFLNDEEFAQMWIRSRTEFKPKGKRLIRLELQQKGVSKETIDKAFVGFEAAQEENAQPKRDELSLAKEILEKKWKKFESMERQERFKKAGSFLARRGFDLDTIKKAIEEVFGK